MNKNDYMYLDHAATTPMREVAFEAYKKLRWMHMLTLQEDTRYQEKQKIF